jgi:hypothetical protein
MNSNDSFNEHPLATNAVEVVRRDLQQLAEMFDAGPEALTIIEDLGRMVDESHETASVAWTINGLVVRRDEAFPMLPITNRPLRITGVTIVRGSGDASRLSRFIDWTSVMSDLGVTGTRPIVSPPPTQAKGA